MLFDFQRNTLILIYEKPKISVFWYITPRRLVCFEEPHSFHLQCQKLSHKRLVRLLDLNFWGHHCDNLRPLITKFFQLFSSSEMCEDMQTDRQTDRQTGSNFYRECAGFRARLRWEGWYPSRIQTSVFIRRILKNCYKRILAQSFLSVCLSAWNNSASTGQIFTNFNIKEFFENLSRKFKFN